MSMIVRPQGFGSICYESISKVLANQISVMTSYYDLLGKMSVTEKDLIGCISQATIDAGIDEAEATRKQAYGNLVGGSLSAASTAGLAFPTVTNFNKSITASNTQTNLSESITTVKHTPAGGGLVLGGGGKTIMTPSATLKQNLLSSDFAKNSFEKGRVIQASVSHDGGATFANENITPAEAIKELTPADKAELIDRLKTQEKAEGSLAKEHDSSANYWNSVNQSVSSITTSISRGAGDLASANDQTKKAADSASSTSGQQNMETLKSVDSMNTKAAQDAGDEAKQILNALTATIMASSRN